MPSLEQLLVEQEGDPKTTVYPDSQRNPTVGIGHKVKPSDKLKLGDQIKKDRIDSFFRQDTATGLAAAKTQAAKAGIKDSNFIIYLAAVNFQLGTTWNNEFKNAWQKIMDGQKLWTASIWRPQMRWHGRNGTARLHAA